MRWKVAWLAIVFIASASTVEAQSPQGYAIKTISNVPYYQGDDADPLRHKLDIHIPRGHKNFPVVFFLHGGGWVHGDKSLLGICPLIARTFVRHGIGMVCPNYRLSPRIKHPEHIRDVARAFAWTYKNIGKYGGRNDQLFVSGHSAGGHLCSLLSTDEQYLKEVGLTTRAIRGAMPVSGLFIIGDWGALNPVFGKDPGVRRQASPITHVRPDLPPFLVLFGDDDLDVCGKPGADRFVKALAASNCQGEICELNRNHVSILLMAYRDHDPAMHRMLSFVLAEVLLDRLAENPTSALTSYSDILSAHTQRMSQ